MNFLGIGPGELFLIAVLTLLVVGPERLPILARRAGQLLVSVRNWLQASPDAQMVLRMRRELEDELANLRANITEMQQMRDQMRDEMLHTAKEITDTVEQEVVTPMKDAAETLQSIPRATTRAAAINGDAQDVLSPPPTDLEPPITEPIIAEPIRDAGIGGVEERVRPNYNPEKLPSIAPPQPPEGWRATLPAENNSVPDAVPYEPPPTIPLVTLAHAAPLSLEQLHERLLIVTEELRSLRETLERRGWLDDAAAEPVALLSAKDSNDVND
jgi:sec-independent protein translocase protein TatB